MQEKATDALFALAHFMKLPKCLTFEHRLIKVVHKSLKLKQLEEKATDALLALAHFIKLPKCLTFEHRLIKVVHKVVQARAIGGKGDRCAFRIGAFYEIAEVPDF
ncbi:hypothetical protein [Enterococcus sp. UD-01]|uniref:hypothetical protein n=1 Tax=Enterococcus sp. UD-01 TaxID=3373911 RepID=UPI003832E63F